MNILICDDIQGEALKLEKTIKCACPEANIDVFYNGADALAFFKTAGANIDVCFLDIIMPEMNGIELARKLRDAKFSGKIIFLTTTKEYGVESYQVKAYSYLLKPAEAVQIADILNEIKNLSDIEDNCGISITTRNLIRFLYFREISLVEVIKHNVFFRLLDGKDIEVYTTLNEIMPKLMDDSRFAQCHRSFVINMDAISKIHGKEIFLRCGRKAPISRSYKEFGDRYFMRIMGKEMQ
ncbi:MAG: LytTR family DNA-binding domain-containing protein [Treponema sp.]|nr:LytTR family DNA-binding domain-containing protein [Treponema sp.]